MFSDLKHPLGQISERDLWLWKEPLAAEVCNFVWDTDVPAVTDPWPTIAYGSVDELLRELAPDLDVDKTQALLEETALMWVIS